MKMLKKLLYIISITTNGLIFCCATLPAFVSFFMLILAGYVYGIPTLIMSISACICSVVNCGVALFYLLAKIKNKMGIVLLSVVNILSLVMYYNNKNAAYATSIFDDLPSYFYLILFQFIYLLILILVDVYTNVEKKIN